MRHDLLRRNPQSHRSYQWPPRIEGEPQTPHHLRPIAARDTEPLEAARSNQSVTE